MTMHDLPANRQTEADATAIASSRLIHLIEPLIEPRQVVFSDADSRVRNRQYSIVLVRNKVQSYLAALPIVRDRVAHHVGDNLTKPLRIAGDLHCLQLAFQLVASGRR